MNDNDFCYVIKSTGCLDFQYLYVKFRLVITIYYYENMGNNSSLFFNLTRVLFI